jgi:hypothetical protein
LETIKHRDLVAGSDPSAMARLACLALLLLASVQGVFARDGTKAGKPTLRIDLRKTGAPLSSVRFADLGFVDNGTLALQFFEDQKVAQKSTVPPKKLWIVTIAANTGQLKESVDLGIQPTITASMFITAQGEILAAIENELVLFSSDLRPTKKRIFNKRLGLLHLSTDRTKLLVPVNYENPKTQYEVIDTDTLETLAGWTEGEHYVWAYSGSFSMSVDFATRNFSIGAPDGNWRPVAIATNPECSSYPNFAAEKLIVQDDCNGTIFWVDAESGTWTTTSIGKKHRSLMHFLPSRNGLRFAATLVFWKFLWVPLEGHGRFTWLEGVQVYDVSTRQPIFTKMLDVSWLMGREYEGGMALSADGTRLAMLNRGILEVYQMPPVVTTR